MAAGKETYTLRFCRFSGVSAAVVLRRFRMAFLSLLSCVPSSAEPIPHSGGVYYEYGAGGLESMTLWVVTLFTYVTDLMFAVAGILVIYNATSIYLKMQTGEGGIIKSLLMLVGSCIFMITMIIVLPAFFGYHYHSHVVPTVFRFSFQNKVYI